MIAVTLSATLLAVAPTADTYDPGHETRARQLNAWAGVLTVSGAALHITALVSLHASRVRQPGLGLMWGGTFLFAHALPAFAVGGQAAGKAHALRTDNAPPRWKRPQVGWPLFAAGLATFVASRVAPIGCFTTTCAVLISETGYVGGMAAMMVGLHAAGFGHGYRAKRRELRLTPQATFTREAATAGLSLSGKF